MVFFGDKTDLFNGYLKLCAEGFFEPAGAGNLRGHTLKARQPRFDLARRILVFAVRTAEPWNGLPPQIAEVPTESNFKDRLAANWCSIFPDIV